MATAGHPFWVIRGEELDQRSLLMELDGDAPTGTVEGRWVSADELRCGDLLAGSAGARQIERTAIAPGDLIVYNLEIAEVHSYVVGNQQLWVHNTSKPKKKCGERPAKNAPNKITPQDIPSYTKNPAEFEAWFDKQTPEQLAEYWKDPKLRAKIKNELLGPGGEHEYLMRAEAPKWKEWGVTARELREKYSVAFDELDKVALFNHSRGTRGSLAPGSKTAHNELQKIIQESKSLNDFKTNLVPWANKWLKGGVKDLPLDLQ